MMSTIFSTVILARLAVITTLSLAGSAVAIGTAPATALPAAADPHGLASARVLDATTAASGTRRFASRTTHYATVTSPDETLSFEWNVDTGVPTRFDWLHGGVAWYLHRSTPGRIIRENPNVNYYDLDIRVTTAGFEKTPNTLKGKLTVNVVQRPDGATFAAILEGTGSAWLVANGTLTAAGRSAGHVPRSR